MRHKSNLLLILELTIRHIIQRMVSQQTSDTALDIMITTIFTLQFLQIGPRKGRHLPHVHVHHLATCTACIITLMPGKALVWTVPAWDQPALLCVNYSVFTVEAMKVSDRPVSARGVTWMMWAICQVVHGEGDYAIVFIHQKQRVNGELYLSSVALYVV